MGFSRYCPSSLDLTNFVVRSCRGAVVELPRSCRGAVRWLSLADSLESGNLEIQESGNPGIWKSGIQQQSKTSRLSESKIPYAQNVGRGLISRENPSEPFETILTLVPGSGKISNLRIAALFAFKGPIGSLDCRSPLVGMHIGLWWF